MQNSRLDRLLLMDEKNYDPDSDKLLRVAVRGIIWIDGKLLLIEDSEGAVKLPGGGQEGDEDDLTTLVREVKEETGYRVIPESVRPYGYIEEKRMSVFAKKFKHQFNNLYFCDVEQDPGECDYSENEKNYGFHCVLCTLDEALERNKASLDSGRQQAWIRREYHIFRLLKSLQ